jgi:hypothetical protein
MSDQYSQYPPGGGQPYDSPPPYGSPPPSPYGSPQPGGYGAPAQQQPGGYTPPSQGGSYGAPPGYGPPPQSGPTYGAPSAPGGYEPYGGATGYQVSPPQPRKSRTALRVAIGLIVVLLIAGGIGYEAFLSPAAKERNAHVSAPATIGTLTKSAEADKVALAESILNDVKKDSTDLKESVAAYYDDTNNPDQPVFLVAATGDIGDPDAELDSNFKDAGNVANVHAVDAGPLGGAARCGSESEADGTVVVCAWADHGSFGVVGFLKRDPANAETLFGQIHQAVLTRG